MKKFAQLFLASSILSISALQAQASNLIDAYELALNQDPAFQQARHAYLADQQLVPITAGQFLPQAAVIVQQQASLNETPIYVGPYVFVTSEVYREHLYQFQLQQSIVNFTTWYQFKQAGQLVDQAKAQFIVNDQSLMYTVAQSYFNVLSTYDTLTFAQAQKRAYKDQLNQTQQQFDVGLVAITDVSEAKSRYDTAVADELRAINDLANAKESLRQITGVLPEELAVLGKELPLISPEPSDIEAWVATAKEYNPQLQVSGYAKNAAEQAINIQKAGHLPQVTASVNWGREQLGTFINSEEQYNKSWTAGIGASMNIFSGGTISANVRRAQYEYLAAEDQLESTDRSVAANTRSAYRAVMTTIAQVQAFQQAVASSKIALEATQAAYEVGTRTIVDLLNSISDLYQREQQLSTARYNYILSQLALKQASGLLSYQDLMAVNTLLGKNQVMELPPEKPEKVEKPEKS